MFWLVGILFCLSTVFVVLGFLGGDVLIAGFFWREDHLKKVFTQISHLGLGGWYFVGALALWAWGAWRKDYFLQSKARFCFAAFLISGLLVQTLKLVIGRRRPYFDPHFESGFDPVWFVPMSWDATFSSFPSGHSQVVFTFFGLVLLFLPRWKWLALGFAVVIALSRVIVHSHFFSDIIAGAWVGVSGVWLTQYLLAYSPTRSRFSPRNS